MPQLRGPAPRLAGAHVPCTQPQDEIRPQTQNSGTNSSALRAEMSEQTSDCRESIRPDWVEIGWWLTYAEDHRMPNLNQRVMYPLILEHRLRSPVRAGAIIHRDVVHACTKRESQEGSHAVGLPNSCGAACLPHSANCRMSCSSNPRIPGSGLPLLVAPLPQQFVAPVSESASSSTRFFCEPSAEWAHATVCVRQR